MEESVDKSVAFPRNVEGLKNMLGGKTDKLNVAMSLYYPTEAIQKINVQELFQLCTCPCCHCTMKKSTGNFKSVVRKI